MTETQPEPTPAEAALGDIAPEFVRLSDEVLFGQVWPGPDLSPRDRSLVTVASLTSLYRVDQMDDHLKRALDNGVTVQELVAAITHLAFYSGWPAAWTAMTHLKTIVAARGDEA